MIRRTTRKYVAKPRLIKRTRKLAARPKPYLKPRRVGARQLAPQLQVFTGPNFTGLSRTYRGNLGIRNLSRVGLNDNIESLRLTNAPGSAVLFREANYQGDFEIFTANQSVNDLTDLNFDNEASSLVVTSTVLTIADVQTIQAQGLTGNNFGEILRAVRIARIRRAAKRRRK